MLDHRDRICVPIEVEMLPLYRDPYGDRLRRKQRREVRRQRIGRLVRRLTQSGHHRFSGSGTRP